jgi:hypothetical protein
MKESCLRKYENFLEGIDLAGYAKLRKIKTVEQDLPKSLNPLPLIYKFYWEEKNFLSYEEFFSTYWEGNLHAVMEFVKKYFYGCSLQFVEEGFKARIYRTWISLLTQFHFQYLWTELFNEKYPLEASADLDLTGIDSRIFVGDKSIGIQIKKVSYRREASQRRFTKRQKKLVNAICEVPYLVIDIEEVSRKLESKRTKEETKKKLRALLSFFEGNFKVLSNGFVVFKEDYLEKVKEVLLCMVNSQDEDFVPYTYFMAEAL